VSATLIVVRTQYSTMPSIESTKSYHQSVHRALEEVSGFEGGGLWVNSTEPGKHLIIYRYKDLESAAAGLEAISDQRLLAQSQTIHSGPPDVISLRTIKESGAVKDIESCTYLSVSIRIAEPGYAADLEQDLERVFQEIQFLDGFTGYSVAVNNALEEEVVGIASWQSEEAFLRSVPEGIIVSVKGYRKA
jgi:heme-degrading monooxygenase HmoA